MTTFDGKTVLVTGGSRGIGRACSRLLAKNGARVAVNYRSGESQAQSLVEEISAAGGEGFATRADVSSPEQVWKMVDAVERNLGPIELLVNNAGIFDFVSHNETTLDIWQRTLDINLTGT